MLFVGRVVASEQLCGATLAASISPAAKERLAEAAAYRLPSGVLQVERTRVFKNQFDKLTGVEKRQAVRALFKAYSAWVHSRHIIKPLKLVKELSSFNVGHVNFNDQRKYIFYIVNTEHNTLFLLSMGTKNRQSESIYHSGSLNKISRKLARLARQCDGMLISEHIIDQGGFDALARVNIDKEMTFGELLRKLWEREDVEIPDTEEGDFDRTLAEQLRDADHETTVLAEEMISLYWEEEDLRKNSEVLFDFCRDDVMKKLRKKWGEDLCEEDVRVRIDDVISRLHDARCKKEDSESIQAYHATMDLTAFSDSVERQTIKKLKLDEKLTQLKTKEKEGHALVEELIAWGYSEDHGVSQVHAALVSWRRSSDFMMFLSSGDTRCYVKARDALGELVRGIVRKRESVVHEYAAEQSRWEMKLTECVGDTSHDIFPAAYREFKSLCFRAARAHLATLRETVDRHEREDIVESVSEFVDELKDLMLLENSIYSLEFDASYFSSAVSVHMERLSDVLSRFSDDSFDDVYQECENVVELIRGCIEEQKEKFATYKEEQLNEWKLSFAKSLLDMRTVFEEYVLNEEAFAKSVADKKSVYKKEIEGFRKVSDGLFLEEGSIDVPELVSSLEAKTDAVVDKKLARINEKWWREVALDLEKKFDQVDEKIDAIHLAKILEFNTAYVNQVRVQVKRYCATGEAAYNKRMHLLNQESDFGAYREILMALFEPRQDVKIIGDAKSDTRSLWAIVNTMARIVKKYKGQEAAFQIMLKHSLEERSVSPEVCDMLGGFGEKMIAACNDDAYTLSHYAYFDWYIQQMEFWIEHVVAAEPGSLVPFAEFDALLVPYFEKVQDEMKNTQDLNDYEGAFERLSNEIAEKVGRLFASKDVPADVPECGDIQTLQAV